MLIHAPYKSRAFRKSQPVAAIAQIYLPERKISLLFKRVGRFDSMRTIFKIGSQGGARYRPTQSLAPSHSPYHRARHLFREAFRIWRIRVELLGIPNAATILMRVGREQGWPARGPKARYRTPWRGRVWRWEKKNVAGYTAWRKRVKITDR